MKLQRTILATLSIAALLIGGCPNNTGDEGVISDAVVTAPGAVSVGETTTLSLAVAGDGDLSTATFRWYQTSGRVVTFDDPTLQEPSFVAPSVAAEATLAFRVDIKLNGRLSSAEATVQVVADPNFGLDSGGGGGGDDEPFPQVRLNTSEGVIVLELNRDRAAVSVSNFLRYVDADFYDGTIFHRVVPEFVIQGGGFTADLTQKETRDPILNESTNGLKNIRGSLAMARLTAPNSATAQFYINLIDNTSLDRSDSNPGYAVFGRVIVGLDVVDKIADLETGPEGSMTDVPIEDVIIRTAERATGIRSEN